MIKLIETRPDLTNLDIAAQMKMDRETVARRRSRPAFRRLFQERNLPARDVLAAYKGVAAKVYVSLLAKSNSTPAVREKVAARLLALDLEPEPVAKDTGGPVLTFSLTPEVVDAVRRYYAADGSGTVPSRRPRRSA